MRELAIFNQLSKEMDEVYHQYARRNGLSDMHLWLLYAFCEQGQANTQREMSAMWHYPPQTVNSAIKTLEKQEIFTLSAMDDNRKNKLVRLTEKGERLVQTSIHPLMHAEQSAFTAMEADERETLLALTAKYVALLQHEVASLSQSQQRER